MFRRKLLSHRGEKWPECACVVLVGFSVAECTTSTTRRAPVRGRWTFLGTNFGGKVFWMPDQMLVAAYAVFWLGPLVLSP